MMSDKGKVTRQQQVGRQADVRQSLLEQNLHTLGKFEFSSGLNFNCNVHLYSLNGNIPAESFPFLQEIFFF